MAIKPKTPIVPATPATPAFNAVFFGRLVTLIQGNTKDSVTLLRVAQAVKATRPIPGVPGLMADVPANYAAGCAKLLDIASDATESKVISNDDVVRQLAYLVQTAQGVAPTKVRSETSVAVAAAKADARKALRSR